MEYDFYFISKSQAINKAQGKTFIIHFPASHRRPVCGKYASYSKVSCSKMYLSEKLLICDDCLTHSGEH